MPVERDRILTLADMQSVPGRPSMTMLDFARIIQGRRGGFQLPGDDEFAGPPAIATIEAFQYLRPGNWRNRWGAHCWLDYDGVLCTGYEDADPVDPRFFCFSCYNEGVGGVWRRVTFPSRADRPLIEDALLDRPDARTRAFIPREAVDVLRVTDPLLAVVLDTDGDTLAEIVRQNTERGITPRERP